MDHLSSATSLNLEVSDLVTLVKRGCSTGFELIPSLCKSLAEEMETSKLGCIGSPHYALHPCSNTGRAGFRCLKAGKTYCAEQFALSCGRPLLQLPLVGVLSNLVSGVSVWAVEAEALSSTKAASMQVSESAGADIGAASQAVQPSMEGAGAAASSNVTNVGDTASKAVQSSVERVGGAASRTVTTAGNNDTVVNILGTAAFIGLSLLSVAIVYLFITDFLEKRKRDEEMKKLNEEEAAARKKKGGSFTAASKGGAKGFGRKRVEVDDN
ncbi:hypothetical protein L7F22_031314 [Adiantum nelumboides]|nr:hypothetical protein [Adiantum nelumboides]